MAKNSAGEGFLSNALKRFLHAKKGFQRLTIKNYKALFY